jgi:hypothetical protein
MTSLNKAHMESLLELPLPAGLWSILSYTRAGELCCELCMSEPEESAKLALLLFDNDVNNETISINGISSNLT